MAAREVHDIYMYADSLGLNINSYRGEINLHNDCRVRRLPRTLLHLECQIGTILFERAVASQFAIHLLLTEPPVRPAQSEPCPSNVTVRAQLSHVAEISGISGDHATRENIHPPSVFSFILEYRMMEDLVASLIEEEEQVISTSSTSSVSW